MLEKFGWWRPLRHPYPRPVGSGRWVSSHNGNNDHHAPNGPSQHRWPDPPSRALLGLSNTTTSAWRVDQDAEERSTTSPCSSAGKYSRWCNRRWDPPRRPQPSWPHPYQQGEEGPRSRSPAAADHRPELCPNGTRRQRWGRKGTRRGLEQRRRRATRVARWDDAGALDVFFPLQPMARYGINLVHPLKTLVEIKQR